LPIIARFNFLAMVLIAGSAGGLTTLAHAAANAAPQASQLPRQAGSAVKPQLDRSGRKRVGKASFYAKKFAGSKMADGTTMRPHNDNAASKTLPLGTTAKVTNLKTGQSAVVTIRDRGPYVKGRIVDLSPSTAQKIGIERELEVAEVEVAPIAVPLLGGSKKPGVAGAEPKKNKTTSADRG
jgi:rare lipoprotein A